MITSFPRPISSSSTESRLTHRNQNDCCRNVSVFFHIPVTIIGVQKTTLNSCHNFVPSHSPDSKIGLTHLHKGWFTFPSQLLAGSIFLNTNSSIGSKLSDFQQSHMIKKVCHISLTVIHFVPILEKDCIHTPVVCDNSLTVFCQVLCDRSLTVSDMFVIH